MRFITVFIAVVSGLLVLAGYYLADFLPILGGIHAELLNAAVILAGVAVLAGIASLISVHASKARRDKKNGIYSALLVVSLFITSAIGLVLGPGSIVMRKVVESVILPVEAALMGILTIFLLYAAIRLLRRRADMMTVVFLLTAVFVLLGSATLPVMGNIPILGDVSRWWSQVWAFGGIRGILIGVALGSFVTGLRVLFGADRPYGG